MAIWLPPLSICHAEALAVAHWALDKPKAPPVYVQGNDCPTTRWPMSLIT